MSFPGTKTPTKSTKKARWQLPMRPKAVKRKCKDGHISVMYADEYYLTPELEEKLREQFPIHSNRRVMQYFGISFSTLQRFKKELGLEKDMKKIRREQAKDTKKICEENGYYDSLRGKPLPPEAREAARKMRLEQGHPLQILKKKNPRRYKRICEKRRQDRTELIRKDRQRIAYGLKPTSRLTPWLLGAVRKYTKSEISKRYNALRRGYLIGDPVTERYILFYDNDTQRTEKFEKNCIDLGFKIQPLT